LLPENSNIPEKELVAGKLPDKEQKRFIEGLKAGNRQVFEEIFNAYYEALVRYCFQKLYSKENAEEIVQDVFIKLWLKRDELNINISLQAYLYRTVLNRVINFKQHLEIRSAHRDHVLTSHREEVYHTGSITEKEIQRLAAEAVSRMPEKRRLVYELSRRDGLKYTEIAEKLNISVKTVEAHLSAALEKLRVHLRDYLDT
jgi:RNA polymerase sigma-70 factor, ECF subfamily